MDLERAMEFLLEQQAAFQARFDAQQARINARVEEQQARFDAQQARINARVEEQQARIDARVEEQQARIDARVEEQQERFDAQIATITAKLDRVAGQQEKTQALADHTEATLRRAIQLSVIEHRRERVRRQALEHEMKKLADSQAMTQESLRALLNSLKQPHNGHDQV